MEEVTESLHELGVYHIEEHDSNEIDTGKPFEKAEKIDEALVTAKSIISTWNLEGSAKKPKRSIDKIISKIKEIEAKNNEYREEERKLQNQISQIEKSLPIIQLIEKLGLKTEYFQLKSIQGFLGRLKRTKGLKEELKQVTTQLEFETLNNHAVVFTSKEHASEVLEKLNQRGFEQVDTTILEKNGDSEKLRKRLEEIKGRLAELQEENEEYIQSKKDFILGSKRKLEEESEKAEAPLDFAVSENTFYIEGYIPDDKVEETKQRLEEVTQDQIAVQELEIEDAEKVPVEMENPNGVENFEFFMDLYSLPKYVETDPTMLTFITFPILFGFMLGDMGYGVVTLLLFLTLRKLLPSMKRLVNILLASSIWTIIFGAMFGEAFGQETLFGIHFPHVFSRLHDKYTLLYTSIAVGVLHVNIGLFVGIYNEWKNHGFKAALFEKVSWIVLEIAAVIFGINYMWGTIPMSYGYATLALAVIMIFKGEGIKGLVELPQIFSNILSYARLMAIGLASAGLAGVVNDFATQFWSQGVWGILGAVLILVLGHTINIALGLLGPFLHSLRLHYVEFFTKFYEGGGKPYTPFGTTRR